jgi:hypothetical protein
MADAIREAHALQLRWQGHCDAIVARPAVLGDDH